MNSLCIRELAEIVGGRLQLGCLPPLGGEHEPLGRVTTCSDRVRQGDVFWGMQANGDNNSWRAEEAFARGALGAVVSGRRLEPWAGKFSLEVDDTRVALWRLAQAMRRRFTGTLIAVAGCGLESAAVRTIQTILRGRPETVAPTIETDEEAALALRLVELGERDKTTVVELRAGEPGELGRQANWCCPHVGVLVGGFDACPELAVSQNELLAALPRDGIAIVNGDDASLRAQSGRLRLRWFGSEAGLTAMCTRAMSSGVAAASRSRSTVCRYELLISGRGQLSAVLAAYAVGRVLRELPRDESPRLWESIGAAAPTIFETAQEYALTT